MKKEGKGGKKEEKKRKKKERKKKRRKTKRRKKRKKRGGRSWEKGRGRKRRGKIQEESGEHPRRAAPPSAEFKLNSGFLIPKSRAQIPAETTGKKKIAGSDSLHIG